MGEVTDFQNPQDWEYSIESKFLKKLDHDWKNVFRLLNLPDEDILTAIADNKDLYEQKYKSFRTLLGSRQEIIKWSDIRQALSVLAKHRLIKEMEILIPRVPTHKTVHDSNDDGITDNGPKLEYLVRIIVSRHLGNDWAKLSKQLLMKDNEINRIIEDYPNSTEKSYEALKSLHSSRGNGLAWSEIENAIEISSLPDSIIFGILSDFQGCPYTEMKSAIEEGKIDADVNKLVNKDQQPSLHSDRYDMKENICGKCIIFSQKKAIKLRSITLDAREGSEHDEKSLFQTFRKLKFFVEIHENASLEKIEKILKYEASVKPNDKNKCLVVCFLTHGVNNKLYTDDGQLLDLHNVVKQLNGENCPSLRGKPKLFFVQACSGKEISLLIPGPIITQDSSSITMDGRSHLHEETTDVTYLNGNADQAVYMASFPGTAAWLDKDNGSLFIQTICEVFEEQATKTSFIKMVHEINKRVVEKSTVKSTPCMPSLAVYSLMQDIYFESF